MKKRIKLEPLEGVFIVKPWGNYLIDRLNGITECRTLGLGLFACFSDEFLHQFLLDYLFPMNASQKDYDHSLQIMGRLCQCSKAFYVFCMFDPLWRDILIRYFGGKGFNFENSWKFTLKKHWAKKSTIKDVPLKIDNFYSDILFSAIHCSNVPLQSICQAQKLENGQWDIHQDTVPRIHCPSLLEFQHEFASTNQPCILTGIATEWTAMQHWNMNTLTQRFGNTLFRAESVDLTLSQYQQYAQRFASHEPLAFGGDEAPLYLFDKHFFSQCKEAEHEFQVPEYFRQDLFSVLEKEAGVRPDYRWIIIGPARSGSTFHIDPNSTSAWNAVIKGAKKWILFPPNVMPPGVFVNADHSEVTSPQSLIEWYIHYYPQLSATDGHLECICQEGEIVFVPNGWWHCVINLEECIAITQNYVDEFNVINVLKFLRDKKEQISGFQRCSEMFDLFKSGLEKYFPELWSKIEPNVMKMETKTSWWNQVTAQNSGFSFTFSANEE